MFEHGNKHNKMRGLYVIVIIKLHRLAAFILPELLQIRVLMYPSVHLTIINMYL